MNNNVNKAENAANFLVETLHDLLLNLEDSLADVNQARDELHSANPEHHVIRYVDAILLMGDILERETSRAMSNV